MFFVFFIVAAALLFAVFSRWFWRLSGLGTAVVFSLVFASGHTRLISYGLDLAVAAAAGYLIWKAAIWVKGRRTIRELPAETTEYPTSPAYRPSRDRVRAGR